ncbi:4-hydroxy-tetrahydrodipicolinate synthase [Paraburkholderia sp. WC7.3g]|uniref:4-hydroxy-tetrahydrodipicolinate synthase n=1 Tax=Paraburkholderia sp. WC7.3g TaxID=2991070 RepID=UPI003D24A9A6
MFDGSVVALVTPMFADGSIDWDSLSGLVDFHASNGTAGIVSVGTTGESPTLDVDEHLRVIERTIKAANGRVPVIAGAGANSTREAVVLTEAVAALGCQGILSVTPYYNKPTQRGLVEHYVQVANSTDLPVILYNVPSRTGTDMLPVSVQEAANRCKNIVGIKEASGTATASRTVELLERCGKTFNVFSGEDKFACDAILAGARGVISVTANIAPRLMAEMCRYALAGDRGAARDTDRLLAGLHNQLFVEPNPIPVKWVLRRMGLIDSGIRLPMTWLSDEHEPSLASVLDELEGT